MLEDYKTNRRDCSTKLTQISLFSINGSISNHRSIFILTVIHEFLKTEWKLSVYVKEYRHKVCVGSIQIFYYVDKTLQPQNKKDYLKYSIGLSFKNIVNF